MAEFLLPIDVARIVPASEYGSRDGAVPSMHIWHHGATTSGWAIEANMEPGGRELSATLVIHNDGTTVGKVPEWARPFTSGSYRYDRKAITSEMANGSVDGWTITDATYEAAGRIAAAEYRLYGIPLDRDHHIGHNELYTAKWGWESYPTYCPGPADRVDWIVELGRRTLSAGTAGLGTTPIPEEEEMATIPFVEVICEDPELPYFAVVSAANSLGVGTRQLANAPQERGVSKIVEAFANNTTKVYLSGEEWEAGTLDVFAS